MRVCCSPQTFGGFRIMKKIISSLILIALFSVAGLAQKQKKSPDVDENIPAEKQSRKNNKKADKDGTTILESGTSIEGQLQQTLDVRRASVGDEVVLTTTKTIKQNGQTVVQKGTRLVGRVTEVQQKTKENTQSKLGVIFERIEGRNLSAPISATIVSITRADAGATLGDTLGSDISGGSTNSGRVSRNSSGGGLLGGVTNTVGGALNTTTNTVGGVTNSVNQTLGGTTNTVGKTLNGVRLSQSTDAAVSGATTLSTQNKNLRIEKGVTFQLRLNQSVEN